MLSPSKQPMCKRFDSIGATYIMSSRPVLVLVALSSFLMVPAAAQNASNGDVSDLLLRDELQQAESLLDKQQRTPQNIAFRGEIEFRKGHFELAKLAMGRVKGKVAILELARAIELDPKVPLYHLYASEAWGIDKNYTEQRKHLETYLMLNPIDEDRVTEAKAGLEMLKAFDKEEVAAVHAPENPAPIRFRKSLNLIFTGIKIDGKGPYEFAIDTGTTQTVISEKLASELQLAPIASTVVFGIGGVGKVETKIYKMKELAAGDVTVKNVPVGTFNDPLISQFADGILGTSIFSDFKVTIDY